MKQKVFQIVDIPELDTLLSNHEIFDDYHASASTLIQIYSVNTNDLILQKLRQKLSILFPITVIVGASSIAQVFNQKITVVNVVLGFTFFNKTKLSVICKSCVENDEYNAGLSISNEISIVDDVVSVMLLTTPLSLDLNEFMIGLNQHSRSIHFFGGGAADYNASGITYVYYADKVFSKGTVAVIFSSKHLQCSVYKSLGWQSLSKEMMVTESDGAWIKKIDGEPAFNVYSRYINIKNDPSFFQNAIDFPLIFNRNDEDCVRSPVDVNQSGEIKFLGDINVGEKFKIGYGNPESIINSMLYMEKDIRKFNPEALFVFACCCRYYLLQEDAELEIQPLSELAPTVGFYTYGELMSDKGVLQLLNSTMVVAAFKEIDTKTSVKDKAVNSQNISLQKHAQIISRLVHFICRVSDELAQSNEALDRISKTDKLTNLNNRMFLDAELNKNIFLSAKSLREKEKTFSVLLLDIDFFKTINDTYGHLVGDDVLINLAILLKNSLRPTDVVGRWGGEEFLILIPESNFTIAMKVAEKIRKAVEGYCFSSNLKLTCSIGVSNFQLHDTPRSIISRVDRALYIAKNNGRNRIFYQ
nr:diguanylate cyclase [uncultured Tolumonas sp.]